MINPPAIKLVAPMPLDFPNLLSQGFTLLRRDLLPSIRVLISGRVIVLRRDSWSIALRGEMIRMLSYFRAKSL